MGKDTDWFMLGEEGVTDMMVVFGVGGLKEADARWNGTVVAARVRLALARKAAGSDRPQCREQRPE